MRIGFDAVRAFRTTTGLGNYARRVIAGLAASGAVEPFLYSPAPPRPELADFPAALGAPVRLPPAGWRGPVARTLWRTFRLGRSAARDGLSLYHGLSHEIPRDLPATGVPSVVSFLDLLWVRFPELYPRVDRLSYEWRYRWSAEHAGAIVAASGQTRRDLVELYRIAPERINVVPPPADPRFGEPSPPEQRRRVLARYGLPGRFLLSVGTLEPRKNQRTAIAALAQLDPARTPPLVLAGRDGGSARALRLEAERLGVERRVHWLGPVAADALPALIQSAALFLYPSLFEGFGLPIVEALLAGVPVITSAGGCFPEAGGPETRYVPATDPVALAEEIRRVLDEPGLAERMVDAGRRHAARFEPGAVTAQLLAVYQSILR